ncbi:DUF4145 domain-containing protein [Flavobacterium sp.]|uniref:DUF4145 domain-containing protein n=1 Tax=Flavobacterium sp. TaxID=239 RepID=UPI003919848E
MSAPSKEYMKSYCRSCCNDNDHRVLFKEKINNDSDDYHYATEYSTVRCLGCGLISFREDFHDYEQAFPTEYGEWEHPISTTLYPPYLRNHKHIENYWRLPDAIEVVYKESIDALKADCKLLAGAGFRAVIEAICIDKDIKGRNLELKINNLAREGLITKKESERLHSIRFLGNDSIHEMKVPNKDQLIIVLNIVEHILKNIYLIDLDIDSKLDLPINDIATFKKLILKKIKEYKIGDDYPLVKYLDKDVRRVKDNFIQFEKELIAEIKAGTFTKLTLGLFQPYSGSTGNVQHYIVS